MKSMIIASIVGLLTINMAFAAENACDAKAAEKKLAGAAKTSFLKKCNREAGTSSCEAKAAEKKIYGAAKNSFIKKCEKEATAS